MHIEFAFYCSGCVTHQQMCNSETPGTSFTMLKSSNLVQGFSFFLSLTYKHVFLIYMETGKFKIKVSADVLSGEGLLPGS